MIASRGGRLLPAIAPLLALATIALLLSRCLALTGGHFVYGLDDPYIHLAMARTFAEHGVWGVSPEHFSAASSSLLWPLALAAIFRVAGPNDVVPFVLNVLVLVVGLAWLYRALAKRGATTVAALAATVGVVFAGPLAVLVFTGLEHVTHAFLSLAFAFAAARVAAADPSAEGRRDVRAAVLLASLVVMARYEGLFLLAAVCGLLFLRGRRGPALAVLAAGLLPVAIFALVSLAHGGYPLPNPVLLKSAVARPLADLVKARSEGARLGAIAMLLGGTMLNQLRNAPHLLALLVACGLVSFARARRGVPLRDEAQSLVVLFAVTMALHLQFAKTGWFYRYEAYLTVFGLAVLALAGSRLWAEAGGTPRGAGARAGLGLAAAGLLALFGSHATEALQHVPPSARDVWQQQWQMSEFARRFYAGQPVVVNDLGLLSWRGGVRCVDFVGLDDAEVVRAHATGRFGPAYLADLARRRGARVAIAYPEWLERWGGVPAEWREAGSWTLAHLSSAGSARVAFYATDPSELDALASHLRDFAPGLPAGVTVAGPPEAAAPPEAHHP